MASESREHRDLDGETAEGFRKEGTAEKYIMRTRGVRQNVSGPETTGGLDGFTRAVCTHTSETARQ